MHWGRSVARQLLGSARSRSSSSSRSYHPFQAASFTAEEAQAQAQADGRGGGRGRGRGVAAQQNQWNNGGVPRRAGAGVHGGSGRGDQWITPSRGRGVGQGFGASVARVEAQAAPWGGWNAASARPVADNFEAYQRQVYADPNQHNGAPAQSVQWTQNAQQLVDSTFTGWSHGTGVAPVERQRWNPEESNYPGNSHQRSFAPGTNPPSPPQVYGHFGDASDYGQRGEVDNQASAARQQQQQQQAGFLGASVGPGNYSDGNQGEALWDQNAQKHLGHPGRPQGTDLPKLVLQPSHEPSFGPSSWQGYGPSAGQGFGLPLGQGFGPLAGQPSQVFGPSPGEGFGPQGFGAAPGQGFAPPPPPQGQQGFGPPPQGQQGFGHPTEWQQGFGHPSQGQQNFSHPNQWQQGFGHPTQGQQGFGHPTQGQQSFGHPTQGQQGFGHPPQGQQGFGHPPQGQQGSGHPTQGQQGFGHPPQGQQGFGHPTQGQQGFGTPTQGQQGFGTPAQGQQGFGPPMQAQQRFGPPTQGQGFGPLAQGQGFGPVPGVGQGFGASQGQQYGSSQVQNFWPAPTPLSQGQSFGHTGAQVQGMHSPKGPQQQEWKSPNPPIARKAESNVAPGNFGHAGAQMEQNFSAYGSVLPQGSGANLPKGAGWLQQSSPLQPASSPFNGMQAVGRRPVVAGKDFASLIDSSFRQGNFGEVDALFDELKRAKIPVPAPIYTILLDTYSQTGHLDKLNQVYKEMREMRLSPGQRTIEPTTLESRLPSAPTARLPVPGPVFTEAVRPTETRPLSPEAVRKSFQASEPVLKFSRPLEMSSHALGSPLPGAQTDHLRPSQSHTPSVLSPPISMGRPVSPFPILKPDVSKAQPRQTQRQGEWVPNSSFATPVTPLPLTTAGDHRPQSPEAPVTMGMAPKPAGMGPLKPLPGSRSVAPKAESAHLGIETSAVGPVPQIMPAVSTQQAMQPKPISEPPQLKILKQDPEVSQPIQLREAGAGVGDVQKMPKLSIGIGRGQVTSLQSGPATAAISADQFVPLSLFGEGAEVMPGMGRGRGRLAEVPSGASQPQREQRFSPEEAAERARSILIRSMERDRQIRQDSWPSKTSQPVPATPRMQLSAEEAGERAHSILLESATRDREVERAKTERQKDSSEVGRTVVLSKEEAVQRAMNILEQNLNLDKINEDADRRNRGKLDKFSEFENFGQRKKVSSEASLTGQAPSPRSRADRRSGRQRPDGAMGRYRMETTPGQEAEMEIHDAEDAAKSVLHIKLKMDFDAQYEMEDFGKNPDVEEKPAPTLEEALEEAKHLLMPLQGIAEESDWQANVKGMLDKAPNFEKLVEAYSGPGRITSRKQTEDLEDLAGKLSPHASPELTAFTQRALLTLQNNPSWSIGQKQRMVKNIVSGFSQYESSAASAP